MRVLILVSCLASIVLFTGCFTSSGMMRKKRMQKRDEIDVEVSIPRRKIKNVKYTFLDTLNRGNELLLQDTDFEKGMTGTSMVSSLPNAVESIYRVQVFASNSIEAIREQKKELEKTAEVQAQIGYEAPYYKLYAGRYSKRQEAQTMLVKLKKKGYLDAWIVSAKDKP